MGYKETDQLAQKLTEQPKVADIYRPYSSFDGMMSFDTQQKNAAEKESVQIYIDKQNAMKRRLDNIEHTWHLQNKTQLSKNLFGRSRVAMKKVIKDFSK